MREPTASWAKRYDGDVKDILAIQDEMDGQSAATLPGASRRRRMIARTASQRTTWRLMNACWPQGPAPSLQSRRQCAGATLSTGRSNSTRTMLTTQVEGVRPGPTWVYTGARIASHLRTGGFRAGRTRGPRRTTDSDVHRILAATQSEPRRPCQATYHQERALALNRTMICGGPQGES